MLRTPKATINVFRTFDWVIEEGWPQIPKKLSKEAVIEEANSSNAIDEALGKKLFKLFFQSHEYINTKISLNPPPTIVAPIMNLPPIMVIPPTNALRIQLPKYHDNEHLVLHI